MNLSSIDLSKILPKVLKEDEFSVALASALNVQFQKIADKIILASGVLTADLAPQSALTDEILDQMAYDLSIGWYDMAAPIDVKIKLVQNGDRMHQIIGTPAAVEQLAIDYFGDGLVEEWFEYGGEPYHYRIITGSKDIELIRPIFERVVPFVQNARSVLDGIAYSTNETLGTKTHSQLAAYSHNTIRNGAIS